MYSDSYNICIVYEQIYVFIQEKIFRGVGFDEAFEICMKYETHYTFFKYAKAKLA